MAAFACPRCRRFYRVKTVGITWEEGRPLSDGTWTSYKLWKGDLLECEGCGTQIIRPAGQPFSEHYMPEYATQLPEAIVRIDDCPGTFSAERALEIRQAAACAGDDAGFHSRDIWCPYCRDTTTHFVSDAHPTWRCWHWPQHPPFDQLRREIEAEKRSITSGDYNEYVKNFPRGDPRD